MTDIVSPQLVYVVPVGILVSLDVVVLTLLSMYRFREGENPFHWAATHAFVHALFLTIGIGLFSIAMGLLHELFAAIAPRLEALFKSFALWLVEVAAAFAEYVKPALEWIAQRIPLLPELLAVLLSVSLCFFLYRAKIAQAAGKGSVDIGFSGAFKSLGTRIYAASVVAMDMWYLTPTLRNVIVQMSPWTKLLFVGLLFVVVFLTVYCAVRMFQRPISDNAKEGVILATLLVVLLVLLEPIGVFYFAFFAAWKVVNPATEHHVGFLIAAVFFTSLLVRGKLLDIVRTQLARIRGSMRVPIVRATDSRARPAGEPTA